MSRKIAFSKRALDDGEKLDPEPLEVSVKRPASLTELVRESVLHHMARAGIENGFESPEEADDFEVDDELDDLDLASQFELQELRPEHDYLESESDPSVPLSEFEQTLYNRLKARAEVGEASPETDEKEAAEG